MPAPMWLVVRYLLLVLFVALQAATWLVGWGEARILPYVFDLLVVFALSVLDAWRARSVDVLPTRREVRERWRWRVYTYAAAVLIMTSTSTVLRHVVGRGVQPDPHPYAIFLLGCLMVGAGTMAYEKALKDTGRPRSDSSSAA